MEDVASGEYRVGRFGWKGQQATLLSFAGDAYVNEMGVTNRLFPHENAPNGDAAKLAACDGIADIEDEAEADGRADIDHLADYMRFLAPPPQTEETASTRAGQTLFAQVGCAGCHVPTMKTGWNDVDALDRKEVNLYFDLLLHEMGSLGDGIAQGMATPSEIKTAPLWGLRAREAFLHDGRAATVDNAIRLHDGQGAAARNRYVKLSPADTALLLQFLQSIC